ncbi:hypothetical protein GCM10020295_73670 [Streptomyces cinereospinus]
MAGALTVEVTEPVTAHTDAAAIATTVTDSTSQPCGRARRTREVELLGRLELGEGLLAELHGSSLTGWTG